MSNHSKIDYVEFPARDIPATKNFFSKVFDWRFSDYGPDYTAFSNAGLNGGFYQSERCAATAAGSALIVLYSKELEKTQQKVEQNGGKISKAIFSFPGGRRFHFIEPSGNELAVWSDK